MPSVLKNFPLLSYKHSPLSCTDSLLLFCAQSLSSQVINILPQMDPLCLKSSVLILSQIFSLSFLWNAPFSTQESAPSHVVIHPPHALISSTCVELTTPQFLKNFIFIYLFSL